jgi:putative two-component system response regulator
MDPTIPIISKQILVVDHSDQVRSVTAQILQIENYEVVQTPSGNEALNILERKSPDLILASKQLSDMSGMAFLNLIRKDQRWSAIPFVFVSAHMSKESIQQLRDLGVEDRLTKPIDPGNLRRVVQARLLRAAEVKVAHIDQAYLETVKVLANAIEIRDRYTRGHVDRVTTYTKWMAEELRWPPENIRSLEFGARLHDIGKIAVPYHILNKPEELNQDEWQLMRQHPTIGAQLLQDITHLTDSIPYILYHHERWDGKGYPEGLSGRDIPIGARMLAITDVYDALTTVRPYRPATPRDEVYQLLEAEAGKHFDPDLIKIFIRAIEKRGLHRKNF